MFNLSTVPVPDMIGRTVLITGAGKGIGAATARILVGRGARVYAGVYQADDVEPLPGEATVLQLDVTRQADVDAAIAQIEREAGGLDALVNNAGVISPIGTFATLPSEALSEAFAVNVTGVHRMSAAALPLLLKRQGAIVNAGTGAATTPFEGWTAYCSSKAGLQMLTRVMSLELAGTGVRAFFLGIPPTDTAMQGAIRASGLNPVSQIPREKLISPDIPASCLAFLCSSAAKGVEEFLLDVRQEVFTRMMDLPA